jgi:hypothetical protein
MRNEDSVQAASSEFRILNSELQESFLSQDAWHCGRHAGREFRVALDLVPVLAELGHGAGETVFEFHLRHDQGL